MRKKCFAILVLCALIFTVAPLEAFCDDHCETAPASHSECGSICHTNFNVVTASEVSFRSTVNDITLQILQDFSYQNPTIARLKRPPIQLA